MSLIKEIKEENINIINSRNLKEIDKICSSYIDFNNPKYVEIDEIYYASLLVINYAREMEALFLNKILSLDIDTQVSLFYEKRVLMML